MRKIKIVILDILILVLLVFVGFQGVRLYNRFKEIEHTKYVSETVKKEAGIKTEDDQDTDPTQETYRTLKAINGDYIGWLKWDSGIISEPVVQGASNNSYLRTDFYGKYDVFGTVFLDSLASVGDDNMPMYGHAMTGVFSDTRKFSQLQNMTKQDFFEANRTFSIFWESSVTRYEVVSAFLIDVNSDEWNYTQNVFHTPEEKEEWIRQVQQRSEIDANAELGQSDKFVTFQTCRDGYSGWRYVVIGRQTGEEMIS